MSSIYKNSEYWPARVDTRSFDEQIVCAYKYFITQISVEIK